jgi:uncharacterized OsmC-like protein
MPLERMEFTFGLKWREKLAFDIEWDFPEAPGVLADEPPALGGSGRGPNASRLVVAGVADCLAASLLFCLQKSRADVRGFRVRAHGRVERNERGRLRLRHIGVELLATLAEDDRAKLERCAGMFEDYCVVTEAVRKGVPVDVRVLLVDGEGREVPVEAPVKKDEGN